MLSTRIGTSVIKRFGYGTGYQIYRKPYSDVFNLPETSKTLYVVPLNGISFPANYYNVLKDLCFLFSFVFCLPTGSMWRGLGIGT